MKDIVIYSKDICPYCVRAKALLEKKLTPLGLSFTEIKVSDDKTREEVVKKSGGRMTVPQIFFGEKHIGGCDDLYALEASGELDALIKNLS